MATILEGKTHAEALKVALKQKIAEVTRKPGLAIIQIGDDERSVIYIKRKIAYGRDIGAHVEHCKLSAEVSEKEVLESIDAFNNRADIDGIIVQLPVPAHIDKSKLFGAITPTKDVDGLGPASVYGIFTGSPFHIPATARAVIHLLKECHIEVAGQRVVIVGRSALVSKPLALSLLTLDATVTICHRQTRNLEEITRTADILIVAAGAPSLIGPSHVRGGQIVIDVGINPYDEGVVGDVLFEEVSKVVAAISPVPGGVGPLTVACLFENVWKGYYNE